MPKALLFFRKLLFTSLMIVISCAAIAQLNNHWHFGQGVSIDFSGGAPILETSSTNTGTTTQPATLSDGLGNLLLYTDGTAIYNQNNNLVLNGDFASNAQENIFAPIPESDNKYYLFRSIDGTGVFWTIIDLSDGIGSVLEEEKDISLFSDYSQLMVTSHANLTDYWLICADNADDGTDLIMTSFLISSAGVVQSSQFSDVYALTIFDDLVDDAVMSPSCVKFATLHKGHFTTLFNFNNENGEITAGFADSGNTGSGFFVEDYFDFTESGDYLYIILDNGAIARFNSNTFNYIEFQDSQESIVVGGNFEHIKRGPDGHMYVINSATNTVDRIIDAEGPSPVLETGVIDLEGLQANYFPSTMNSCQSEVFINVNSVCIGDSTTFLANIPSSADSLYWIVTGDGIADTIYDVAYFTQLYNQPNELTITLNYLLVDTWYFLEAESYIFAQPTVSLPEDIITCAGETIELSVGETPFNILWSTSATTPFIEVTNTGNYGVTLTNGLCSAADQIAIEFIQEPEVNMEDIVICDEQIDVTLTATGQNIDDYMWYDGTEEESIVVDESGIYSVVVSNQCFTETEDVMVTYVFFPPSLIDSLFTLCGADTLDLESAYQEGSITWTSGDTGPFASIYEEGDFTIQINHLGCLTSDEFIIERLPYVDAEDLIIPNVVSVNDDDLNDVFRAFDPRVPSTNICGYSTLTGQMIIFNRWGNEIYAGGCLWNGEIDNAGKEVSEGIYYYIIDIESNCKHLESEKEYVGTVHVLK